jgi:hypothetical protein
MCSSAHIVGCCEQDGHLPAMSPRTCCQKASLIDCHSIQ